jgi:chloramphenicol 3-O-phosphotransferase
MFALLFGFDAFVFDCPPARLTPPTVKQAIRIGGAKILLIDAAALLVLVAHHSLLGSAF